MQRLPIEAFGELRLEVWLDGEYVASHTVTVHALDDGPEHGLVVKKRIPTKSAGRAGDVTEASAGEE